MLLGMWFKHIYTYNARTVLLFPFLFIHLNEPSLQMNEFTSDVFSVIFNLGEVCIA